MAMANGGGADARPSGAQSGGRSARAAHGSAARSEGDGNVVDFARLEGAVGTLIERQAELRAENADLRRRLAEAEQRAQALDERVLVEAQRRRDAVKLLDQLLGRVDELDGHLQLLKAQPSTQEGA